MKRIISIVLMLAMCVAMFAACSSPVEGPANDLATAKELLVTMYRDKPETTNVDYKLVGQITIAGTVYPVEWTADSDTIKFTRGDDNKVTVDIDERNPEEVKYVLTATISDAEGNKETVSFNRKVPAAIIIDEGMSYEDIVKAAYKLESGISMDGKIRLFGEVIKINTPYDAGYKNVTVTIKVGDLTDMPMMCYRLQGEGCDKIAVGDFITVEGTAKNYNGTIELDAKCEFLGFGEIKDQSAALDAAYALEENASIPNPMTLVGIITKIDTPYDSGYKNITVTMVCGGDTDRKIMCYRLQGEGTADLAVGDCITVTGTIKNYKGTIEFDAKCTLDKVIKGKAAGEEVVAPTDPKAIVDAAFALAAGESLPYQSTLTGKVVSIKDAYSEQYKNITLSIEVEGKTISCYRLKGDGADKLAVGDTITVTGTLTNYNGNVQFGSGCTFTK